MTFAADAVVAKNELRARVSASRRGLSPAALASARAEVCRHVLARLDLDAAAGRFWRSGYAYDALRTEPGSPELLAALTGRGVEVHIPLLRPDGDLDWLLRPPLLPSPTELAPSEPSPSEPSPLGPDAVRAATVLLVPALAVDRSGMRLGRGGGSYDRALARVAPTVPIIALLHRGELLDHVPAQPWDRRVTAVIDPDGWHDLAG